MGAFKGYSLGSPTNQTGSNALQYEFVGGVAQRVPVTTVSNGSKTTFGVDSQAYVKPTPYSSTTPISSIPSKSLLTSVLTATGYGAMVATVGDMVASPIIKMYQDKIASLKSDSPASTLSHLLSAISAINVGVIPVTSSIPNAKPSLIDILSQSTENLSKIATYHEAIYKNMLNSNNSGPDDVKSILASYADSVNKLYDDKITNAIDFLKNNIDGVNDRLLSNNSYIDDLNTNFKDAIDKSFSQNNDALTSLNDSFSMMNSSIEGISRILAIDGIVVQKTEKDLELLDLEIDKHNYHKTVQDVVDMDGNKMASVAPRDLKNIVSASTARKHTDQNNFEVTDDDIDTMFTMPDISEIFKYGRLTDRLQTSLDGMTATN